MSSVLPDGARSSRSLSEKPTVERFTLALVSLTRTVWDPDCTFETAVGAICKTAAHALLVDVVSVWHLDHEAGALRCLQSYNWADETFAGTESLQRVQSADADYLEQLQNVRTLDAALVHDGLAINSPGSRLRYHLSKNSRGTTLEAPACVEGVVQGVIRHESASVNRVWRPEELTFVASMGDYVSMAYEITRRRSLEADVEHLLLHDVETGLPNRAYLKAVFTERLIRPQERKDNVAVLAFAIDIPALARSDGAPTDNEIMRRLATVFSDEAAPGVEVGRSSSSSFMIIMKGHVSERAVIKMAERCLARIGEFTWRDVDLEPRASCGITMLMAGDHLDVRTLMSQAEEAASVARAKGAGSCEIYNPASHEVLVESLRMERALRDGLALGNFEVHYQPECDTARGRWGAAEALLRWNHEGVLVSAAQFIAVAEAAGLMVEIGAWVLARACADASAWPANSHGEFPIVRVNVSARQFEEGGFPRLVEEALRSSGLSGDRLCLEITETTLMVDMDRAQDILREIKSFGVLVAIDDFGTGYAPLLYLKRFAVDTLKIDRGFVTGIADNATDHSIVSAVVHLARLLKISVVAEGVETGEQKAALESMGVHKMQGWLFARAMSNDDFVSRLSSSRSLP